MNMQKVPETPITIEVRALLEEYTQRLMNLYPERFTESDLEAWREEYLKKQAAGVKFEKLWYDGFWRKGECDFNGPQKDYREVPQEASNVKETGVGIPEASRETLKAWQAKGLKFKVIGITARFALEFTDKTDSNYSIPEQPIPEGMSVETVEAMWRQGLILDFSKGTFEWNSPTNKFNWNRNDFRDIDLLNNVLIPAQPIPEKLLEVSQETSIADKLAFTENNEP